MLKNFFNILKAKFLNKVNNQFKKNLIKIFMINKLNKFILDYKNYNYK